MVGTIDIRPAEKKDLSQILILHYESFPKSMYTRKWSREQCFKREIDKSRILVAATADSIVGYVSFITMADSYEDDDNSYKSAIWTLYSAQGRLGSEFDRWLAQCSRKLGRQIQVAFWDNDFTHGNIEVEADDIDVGEIAVRKGMQRRGIGRRLMEEIFSLSRANGSSAIYALCWEGKNSVEFFQSFGFEPILRYAPYYKDGSGVTRMGRRM